MELKKYNKENNYSYSFGAFPTYELLQNHIEDVIEVIVHEKISKSTELDNILHECQAHNIPLRTNGKIIEKLSGKGNIYIMGVFKKYSCRVDNSKNQVLLVNPSDMGNLGTIIREMLGFGYNNLSIIKPCADIFDPKVIRASMGAIFSMNIELFDNIDNFLLVNKNHKYPFMLQATTPLHSLSNKITPHTLIFGNEATGLDDTYLTIGTPVIIKHSNKIDSLNLSMSASIALYEFSRGNF